MKDVADISKPALRTFQGRIEYLQAALGIDRPMRVADVGANPVNVPDYKDLLEMGACHVWGFEPEPSAFAELQKQAGPGRNFVQRAVGKTGKGTFYPHQATGLGSLLKIDEPSVRYLGRPGWFGRQGEGVDIDLIAMDDIPDNELPKPDLLKMDIQGGELDVLESARDKLSDAVVIIPEVRFAQMYVNEPMWAEVDRELRDQGLILHKLVSAKSIPVGNSMKGEMKSTHFRNQLVDGDAVYIRDPRGMETWSDDQIRQLALAAAGVFSSLDLVVFCMDQLAARGVIATGAPKAFFKTLPKWIRKQG